MSSSPLQPSKFDYLLLESIDDALADLLGRRSRDQVFDHLATRYGYGRDEVPVKICEFYEFLEKVFSSGAKTIGRTIIRRLCRKLSYTFVNLPDLEFLDLLAIVRAKFEHDAENPETTSQGSITGAGTSFRRMHHFNSTT